MRRTLSGTKRLAAAVAAMSFAVAACGSGSDTESTTITTQVPATAESNSAALSDNLFPDTDVQLVADGSTVNLKEELGGGELPVLLWFWAPH